jgi:hypothetical protein
MMEASRTFETSVDNYFTQQYTPEDNSENHQSLYEIQQQFTTPARIVIFRSVPGANNK